MKESREREKKEDAARAQTCKTITMYQQIQDVQEANSRHLDLLVAELLASVHRQRTGSESKSDSLRTVFTAMTLFAVEFGEMLATRHRIQ